ncbi:hypothetical protein B0T14DRAFT_514535 [Immersiella caudata]|uniref:Uncharacterized protein n=1 Tax=Immersiella caudata TaxID=314043 RepID=A0AA40C2P8_9PEZI|nr:hypothetical protein B0T14DRAFT_514535 [Immersiella caudata]
MGVCPCPPFSPLTIHPMLTTVLRFKQRYPYPQRRDTYHQTGRKGRHHRPHRKRKVFARPNSLQPPPPHRWDYRHRLPRPQYNTQSPSSANASLVSHNSQLQTPWRHSVVTLIQPGLVPTMRVRLC